MVWRFHDTSSNRSSLNNHSSYAKNICDEWLKKRRRRRYIWCKSTREADPNQLRLRSMSYHLWKNNMNFGFDMIFFEEVHKIWLKSCEFHEFNNLLLKKFDQTNLYSWSFLCIWIRSPSIFVSIMKSRCCISFSTSSSTTLCPSMGRKGVHMEISVSLSSTLILCKSKHT